MLIQTAFNFSSVVQRWVCRFSGLRLVALRWFLVFLASSRCAASASSYCFGSAAPPRWRCAFSQFVPVAKSWLPVLASGSNISVKPTRLRRSAYLARSSHHPLYARSHLFQRSALYERLSSLLGLQRLCSKRHQLSFLQCCAAFVAQRFFMGCALVPVRALPFGLRV